MNILIGFVSVSAFILTIIIIIVFGNEKKRKEFIKNIKQNDKCNYRFVTDNTRQHDMWVSKIDGDNIEITFKAQKRFISK